MLHLVPPRESPFSQGSSSSTEFQLPRMHSFIHRMHKHKLAQLIIVSIRVITFIIELGYRAPRESHSLIIFYLTQLLLDKHKFTTSKKKVLSSHSSKFQKTILDLLLDIPKEKK